MATVIEHTGSAGFVDYLDRPLGKRLPVDFTSEPIDQFSLEVRITSPVAFNDQIPSEAKKIALYDDEGKPLGWFALPKYLIPGDTVRLEVDCG